MIRIQVTFAEKRQQRPFHTDQLAYGKNALEMNGNWRHFLDSIFYSISTSKTMHTK